MTDNKWQHLLSSSLQDEPLSLDYRTISLLLHPTFALPSHSKDALLFLLPPASSTGNTSWVLHKRTHEGKDYVIYRAVKSFLTVCIPVKKKKIKKNLICCSSRLQPLQIRAKYLPARTSQQGIPPAKYIILAFKTTHEGGNYWIILGPGTGDLHLTGFITLNNSTTDL